MNERLWLASENVREMILHGSASVRNADDAIAELILAARAADEAEALAHTSLSWREAQ